MAKNTKYSLPKDICLPKHVVIIPDGNRRWARARGKPTLLGHKKGFDVAADVVREGRRMGIHTMTLWAFSTNNWDRTEKEINYLMLLYSKMIDQHLKEALRDKVRIIHLGHKDRIPKALAKKIANAEKETAHFHKNILNIALDYNGRDDITRNLTNHHFNQPTESEISALLDTKNQPYPDPDLIIRTSGEQRTSGILCWQAAQTELYWVVDHFPDFSPQKLAQILIDYSRRRRRFGGNDQEQHLNFSPLQAAKNHFHYLKSLHQQNHEQASKYYLSLLNSLFGISPTPDLISIVSNFIGAQITQSQSDIVKNLIKIYTEIKNFTKFSFDPEWLAHLEQDRLKLTNKLTDTSDKQPLLVQYTEVIAETFRINQIQAEESARLFTLASSYLKSHPQKDDLQNCQHTLKTAYLALKNMVA